jgi:hypothetical protein
MLLGFEDDQKRSEKYVFLLTCHETFALNRTKEAHEFTGAMQTPWSDGVKFNYVFLLVTHAVPYMERISENFQ